MINEMKEFNNVACCLATYHDLQDGFFIYDPVYHCIRHTTIGMNSQDKQVMAYCPHCGAKLPYYSEEFNDALTKIIGEDDEEIPAEFRSDEWWKRRGITGIGKYWKMYDPIKLKDYD